MQLKRIEQRSSTPPLSRRLAGQAFILLLLALFATASPVRTAGARSDRHVVLITLDGFAARYLDDPNASLPNLRRLAAEGARADAMTVVTPSVTWPNHTTLVTGVTPARHSVIANGMVERGEGAASVRINPRHTKEEMCRVPTVYDLAHQAGLQTAEVDWPVTRDAPTLDWRFPDHPEPLSHATPTLVKELVERKILASPEDRAFSALSGPAHDEVWTRAAVHLIREHRPHLLLLHLLNTDGIQHRNGAQTAESYTAVSLADRFVGNVLDAIRDAGLRSSTTVIVTADHGFTTVVEQVRPNARLRQAGIPGTDAFVFPEAGVGYVYVPDAARRPELVERVRKALADLRGVDAVLGPRECAELGFPTPAQSPQAPALLLSMKDGFACTSEAQGPETQPVPRPTGSHGYVHTRSNMDALFVAAGASVRRGARLGRIRNVDVAPTIARLLGLEMRDVDGKPLTEMLSRDRR